MQKMFRIAAAVALVFPVLPAGAQNASIKGKVTGENDEPLPFATVVLKRASDSTLYKGELADENGLFEFSRVKADTFLLELRNAGYNSLLRPAMIIKENDQVELGSIRMTTASQNLGQVDVVADKPFIERKTDRTVVNVENSSIHANSSVLELLEKLPGVLVSQDGAVSLKGKQGVIITIDGKPTGLTGQDLANILRGMSSANIQKIEIISNPSARYDAAGSAGIINIVMKKNLQQGFNGSVNAGYGQGRYDRFNGGFSLAYRRNKMGLYLNYSAARRKAFNNLVIDRYFYDADTLQTYFDTDNYMKYALVTHSPRLGADFSLSDKTTLSFLATGALNLFDTRSNNHMDVRNGSYEITGSNDFITRANDNWYNYSGNAQLVHRFDTSGQEITADLDYASYWNLSDQLFTTTLYDSAGAYSGQRNLIGDQDGTLQIYAAKTDYVRPLKKKSRLEAGLKSSYVEADNNVLFFNEVAGVLSLDSSVSNHFIYSENIHAAYANWHREFTKLSLQLGLRAEQTIAKGNQKITGQTFSRNYIQPFPSVFLDYKFNDKHGLNLSLGRRIDRPAYEQMNPFRELIDAATYAQGNPYLRPQIVYNSELTYTYNQSLFVSFGYSLTTDNITDVLIQDAVNRQTIQTVVNLEEFNYYSLTVNYSKKLTKWWTTNTSLLSYLGVYTGTIHQLAIDQGEPSFFLNTNNNFPLSDKFAMECGLLYSHRNLAGVTTILTNYNLSLGAQWQLLNKKATLKLNVTDLLWKAYPSGITRFGNVTEYWVSYRDTRVANISFSYRFGKGQTGRMRRNTGADEEKQRTGVSG